MPERPLSVGKVKKKLKDYLDNKHKAGERTGGSGHLGFLSIENINVENIQRKPGQEPCKYEISYKYDVFVETEFEHTGDANFGKKHYTDKVTMDENYVIID